jgi:hypothetical protein
VRKIRGKQSKPFQKPQDAFWEPPSHIDPNDLAIPPKRGKPSNSLSNVKVTYPEIAVHRLSGPHNDQPGILGNAVDSPDTHLRHSAPDFHDVAPQRAGIELDKRGLDTIQGVLDDFNSHPTNKGKGWLLGEFFGHLEGAMRGIGVIIPEPFFSRMSPLSTKDSTKFMLASRRDGDILPIKNARIYAHWKPVISKRKTHRKIIHLDLEVV